MHHISITAIKTLLILKIFKEVRECLKRHVCGLSKAYKRKKHLRPFSKNIGRHNNKDLKELRVVNYAVLQPLISRLMKHIILSRTSLK